MFFINKDSYVVETQLLGSTWIKLPLWSYILRMNIQHCMRH